MFDKTQLAMVNNPIQFDGESESTIFKDDIESFRPNYIETTDMVVMSAQPPETDSEQKSAAPIVSPTNENRFESTPLLLRQPLHITTATATAAESVKLSLHPLQSQQQERETFGQSGTGNSGNSYQNENGTSTSYDTSFGPPPLLPAYRIEYPLNDRTTSNGNDHITFQSSSVYPSTSLEPDWTVPFIMRDNSNHYNRTDTTTTVTTTSTSTANSVYSSSSTHGRSLRPHQRRRLRQDPDDIESSETILSTSLPNMTLDNQNHAHTNRPIHPPVGVRASLDAGMTTLRQWVRSRTTPSTPSSLASTSEVAARTLSATADPTQRQSSLRNEHILQLLHPDNTGTSLLPPMIPQSTPFREQRRIRSATVTFVQNPFISWRQQQQHEQQENYSTESFEQITNQHDVEEGGIDELYRRQRSSSEPDAHHMREFFSSDGTGDTSDLVHTERQRTMLRRRRSGQHAHTDDPGPSNQQTPSGNDHRRRGFQSNLQQDQQQQPDPTNRNQSIDTYEPMSTISSIGYSASNNLLNQAGSFPQTFATEQPVARNTTPRRFRISTDSMSNSGFSGSAGEVVSDSLFSTVDSEILSESAPLTTQSTVDNSQVNDSIIDDGDDNNSIVNRNNSTNGNNNNSSEAGHDEHNSNSRIAAEDPDRLARLRWIQINRRFQLVIAIVALVFSLLLFAILIGWVGLTSTYVTSIDKPCDVPLKVYYWLVTFQLLLDVFRNDIMRHVFQWDSNSGRQIPRRVVAYNLLYLFYAFLVLRLGVMGVFNYDDQISTCQETAHDFFNATRVFVSLSLAAWVTIICGYLLPFCVVACLLTVNGYNPSATSRQDDTRLGAGHAVFPAAYVPNGAPLDCIDHIPIVTLSSFDADHPKECCICMEDFKQDDILIRTNCQHTFHRNCCCEWLRQARTCPICRDDLVVSHMTGTNNSADTDGQENNDDGDIEISSIGPSRPPASNNEEYTTQPATIPIGPTGRPVVGLIRLIQNVSHGGIENTTGVTNNVTVQNDENNTTVSNAVATNRATIPTANPCPETSESAAVETFVSPRITDDVEHGVSACTQ